MSGSEKSSRWPVKPGEVRYWPTVKAYEVAGQPVPVFIRRRDERVKAER